jgi:hypothetical protein
MMGEPAMRIVIGSMKRKMAPNRGMLVIDSIEDGID